MSSVRETIKQNLLNELNKLPVRSLSTNKKEISVRCPNCGDSKKNPKSSHLYINIDTTSDKFLGYYCQRCKTKGYINSDFLKSLKIKNQGLVIDINKHDKENKRKNRNYYNKKLKRSKSKFPIYKKNKVNLIKLKYINQRLGTNLTLEDMAKYKIVLNLYDYLDVNNIKSLSCKELFGDTLDGNFIGFVSYDNNYIIMRNLSKTVMPDVRYHNYNIYNNYDNTKKFYIVPNKIDVMNPEITIVITEGVFDILAVYFNIENDNLINKAFVAVGGIGYNNVIQEFIRMGFLEINLKIYGDNDQDIRMYKTLKNDFSPFIKRAELYTNTIYKDFGDMTKGYKIKKTIL